MKRKFDILFENVMQDIEKSYVTYEMFEDWKIRMNDKISAMSKEQAEKYIKQSLKRYKDDIAKQQVLLDIYNNIFKEPLLLEQKYDIFTDQYFDDILTLFLDEDREDIKEIKERVLQATNHTLNEFKEQFPNMFDDVTIELDCYRDSDDVDTYAKIDETNPNNILFNCYPIIDKILFERKSLDDILDELEFDNPVIGHELAHILDIRKRGWPNKKTVHDKKFQQLFKMITKKDYINYTK